MFNKNLCTKCGRCKSECKSAAIDMNSEYRIDKSKCTECTKCVDNCLSGALVTEGRNYSVEDVIKELKKIVFNIEDQTVELHYLEGKYYFNQILQWSF